MNNTTYKKLIIQAISHKIKTHYEAANNSGICKDNQHVVGKDDTCTNNTIPNRGIVTRSSLTMDEFNNLERINAMYSAEKSGSEFLLDDGDFAIQGIKEEIHQYSGIEFEVVYTREHIYINFTKLGLYKDINDIGTRRPAKVNENDYPNDGFYHQDRVKIYPYTISKSINTKTSKGSISRILTHKYKEDEAYKNDQYEPSSSLESRKRKYNETQ